MTFQSNAFQRSAFQYSIEPSVIGVEIREKFPEHSPIHTKHNPMRELLEYGIGFIFDMINEEIFQSSDMRFLITATDFYLDLFGERYGIKRNGRSNDEYRAVLIAIKSATPTIAGIKRSVSKILDITEEEVIVLNEIESGCHDGSTAADHFTGTPCKLVSHEIYSNSSNSGVVTVKIPSGSGIDVLESVVDNLVLGGVTVILKEYTVL